MTAEHFSHFQPAIPQAGDAIAERMLAQVVAGRRCQRAILAVLPEVGITDSQLLVLWGIGKFFPAADGVGVGQSELAQSLGISPAQVSGLVEQLRLQGNLDCQRAEHDRRLQLWQLTDSGRARLRQALACLARLEAEPPRATETPPQSASPAQSEAA